MLTGLYKCYLRLFLKFILSHLCSSKYRKPIYFTAAFRYLLQVLKIYSLRHVHCRLSALAVNFETQSLISQWLRDSSACAKYIHMYVIHPQTTTKRLQKEKLVNMQKRGHLADFIGFWICYRGSCPE